MDITFKVVSYHRLSPDQEPEKTFSSCNFTMGRSLDNDWVLPDPERIISGQHATVTFTNGQYYINDTSTNGLFVNKSETPLGHGNSVRLNDGDHITLGEYELDVVLNEGAAAQPAQPQHPAGQDPMFAGLTPSYGGNNQPPAGNPPSLKPMDFGEEDNFFQPPEIKPQAPQQPVSAPVSSPNVVIPDDWDMSEPTSEPTGFENQPSGNNVHHLPSFDDVDLTKGEMSNEELGRPIDIPEPVIPEGFQPKEAANIPPVDNITPLSSGRSPTPPDFDKPGFDEPGFDTPNFNEPSFDRPMLDQPTFDEPVFDNTGIKPPHPGQPAPFADSPQLTPEPIHSKPVQPTPIQTAPPVEPTPMQPIPEQPASIPPLQSHIPQQPSPQPPAYQPSQTASQGYTPNASDSQLVEALIRGLGVDRSQMPEAVSEEFMETAGQMLRNTVEGVMEILRARTNLKSEFRANQTMIRPAENNPLKFSPSFEDAMSNLFVKTSPSYLPPVKAMEEAIIDIKTHQLALMAGFQGALTSLLDKFEPENIISHASKSAFMKKANYWEQYKKIHHEVRQEAEDNVQKLFGEEFARAYEQQSKGIK